MSDDSLPRYHNGDKHMKPNRSVENNTKYSNINQYDKIKRQGKPLDGNTYKTQMATID